MRLLRVDDAKPAAHLLLLLLASGVALALALVSSPTLLGKPVHSQMTEGHTVLAFWLLPLCFLRGFEDRRWGGALCLAVALWLVLLPVAVVVRGDATRILQLGLAASMVGFAALRLLVSRAPTAWLDSACLLALGLAFSGSVARVLPLLPLMLALGAITRTARPRGVLVAAGLCLMFRMLTALGVSPDLAWLGVLATGAAVSILVFKHSLRSSRWERWIDRLQAAVLLQAIGLAFFLGITREIFLHDTLAASAALHFFLVVPLLAWLRQRRAPTSKPAWLGLAAAAFSYHVFVWTQLLLGLSGMPRMYAGYDGRFRAHFIAAALGALGVLMGALLFCMARRNDPEPLPRAATLSETPAQR
jgi:hypothetical protein